MKVLIVEDNLDLALSIKDILRSKGWVVEVADREQDALFHLANSNYDAIILDLMLRDKDGINVLQEARKKNINTPVLILTVKSDLEDKTKAFKSGADDYLIKPFEMKELLLRLEALIRRTRQSTKTEIKCGDLTLDTSSFMVYLKDKPLPFTRKQFLILEKLISSKGKLVTTEQLLNYAWSIDEDPSTFSLRSHIRAIRKLIKGSGAYIKTVYGIGYSIDDQGEEEQEEED